MATTFPAALDTFVNPNGLTPTNLTVYPHAQQHANANDAIEALQAKVGVDNSTDINSVDYKIRNILTQLLTIPPALQAGDNITITGNVISAISTPSSSASSLAWESIPTSPLVANKGYFISTQTAQNYLTSQYIIDKALDEADYTGCVAIQLPDTASQGDVIRITDSTMSNGGNASTNNIRIFDSNGHLYDMTNDWASVELVYSVERGWTKASEYRGSTLLYFLTPMWVIPPSASTDPGQQGQIAYDFYSGYFYVCVENDTWLRTPLATW